MLWGLILDPRQLHIVHFNSENQIQQIRIYWDQASLLKQVEVIGARGRGWPIREAKEQTRFIKSAAAAAAAPSRRTNQSNDEPENGDERSKRASPGKKHIKDPHAAGSLYELLSPEKDRAEPVRAPRAPASAKPPPREYSELFVGADDPDDADVPDATPSKSRIAPKAGAGKNFRASRIFDDDETVAAEDSHRQIAYRANPKRFDHFEIGGDNSRREVQEKPTRPGSRHATHWDFDDFTTPEKPRRQPRGEEIRHFGWSDDEPDPTPVFQKHVPQPRRDAETHFSMTDDKEEETSGPRYIRAYGNKGMSLYKSHLFDDAEEDKSKENAPLSTVHNGANRREFESHWTATDESPADGKSNENKKPVGADRQKALKNMESQWEAYDESPQPSKFVRPPPQRRAIRKVNERSWGLGDDE